MIVGDPEVGLDIFPNVFEISEVEIEDEIVFFGDEFVLDGVSIIAENDLLIGRVDIFDEGKVEAFSAGLVERFVIRFEVHTILTKLINNQ